MAPAGHGRLDRHCADPGHDGRSRRLIIYSRIDIRLRARNIVEGADQDSPSSSVRQWRSSPPSASSCRCFLRPSAFSRSSLCRIFSSVSTWSPQIAIRADQVGSSGAFGAVPVFVGTALIALIAMVVAIPIGLLSAIYLSEYAHPTIPGNRQTAAGDPGRHPNRGLRLFRRPDRGAFHPRSRHVPASRRSPRRAPWPPAWSWAS